MLSKTKFRLTELLVVVLAAIVGLVWAERTAWQQINSLRTEVTPEQIAARRSADALRGAILELHAAWRQGVGETGSTNRTQMEANGRIAGELIQTMANKDSSPSEKKLNNDIAHAFDDYFARISQATDAPDGTAPNVTEQEIAIGFERLLALNELIARDNRTSSERVFASMNTALTRLQRFIFVSLSGLLVGSAVIIVLIYRRTIAPLQSNLTQSLAIIERQEKLASLGVLAAGIAHEIRNPLTAIKVRLFTLKSSYQPGTSEHEDLEVIRHEIDRLENLVRDFLQFARPPELELQTMTVECLLQDVHELLQSDLARKSVQLQLEVQVNGLVRVDPSKMKQVLINFVQNGAESMDARGTVTLRSRMDTQELDGRNVPTVVIDIADTGKGIPPEVQKRLFDPFFTTKEAGTGLGLPIAARIVEKHGGVIQYQTHPNRGTTFSIVLPIAQKK